MSAKVPKSEEEWRALLTPEQFSVLRMGGTELPFTGKLDYSKKDGNYLCAGCGAVLFKSGARFDSGTGWPSFFRPASEKAVREKADASHGMARREVLCSKCGSHLGHVFEDGPQPTGLRYCINSCSLGFRGKKGKPGD